MNPNLKLIIDQSADIKNCLYFIKNESDVIPSFLDKFLPLNFQYIMNKKFSSIERNKIVREYTRHIYKINNAEIEHGVDNTMKRWEEIEEKFYRLVADIFKGHKWPRGNYIGTTSKRTFYKSG